WDDFRSLKLAEQARPAVAGSGSQRGAEPAAELLHRSFGAVRDRTPEEDHADPLGKERMNALDDGGPRQSVDKRTREFGQQSPIGWQIECTELGRKQRFFARGKKALGHYTICCIQGRWPRLRCDIETLQSRSI